MFLPIKTELEFGQDFVGFWWKSVLVNSWASSLFAIFDQGCCACHFLNFFKEIGDDKVKSISSKTESQRNFPVFASFKSCHGNFSISYHLTRLISRFFFCLQNALLPNNNGIDLSKLKAFRWVSEILSYFPIHCIALRIEFQSPSICRLSVQIKYASNIGVCPRKVRIFNPFPNNKF